MGRAPAIVEERGYAMVALLILMAVMAIAMTVALPAWSTMARREREAELVFRGEQYARAIMLFQRKYAGTFPPNFDVLVNEHFLRKKYKDPIANDDFRPIGVGEAVAGAQTTNPLDRSNAGRGAAATRGGGAGAGPVGSTTGQQQIGRSTFTLQSSMNPSTTGAAAGRAGGFGTVGGSAGIMGVTSKSTDESIRVYKGADHYNQWLFIATQATTQAGGRGAQTPGQGVRGGAPPTPGRGGQPPVTPFGSGPFRPGQPPAGPAGPGRGRF